VGAVDLQLPIQESQAGTILTAKRTNHSKRSRRRLCSRLELCFIAGKQVDSFHCRVIRVFRGSGIRDQTLVGNEAADFQPDEA
jgi:hypothetical protein